MVCSTLDEPSRLVPFLAALATPVPARGQDLPKRTDDPGIPAIVPAKETRSSWACNRASLASGSKCVFEGSPRHLRPAEQARQHEKLLAATATSLFSETIRPSATGY